MNWSTLSQRFEGTTLQFSRAHSFILYPKISFSLVLYLVNARFTRLTKSWSLFHLSETNRLSWASLLYSGLESTSKKKARETIRLYFLFPFPHTSLPGTACYPTLEKHCFVYFVWFSSCVGWEDKFEALFHHNWWNWFSYSISDSDTLCTLNN